MSRQKFDRPLHQLDAAPSHPNCCVDDCSALSVRPRHVRYFLASSNPTSPRCTTSRLRDFADRPVVVCRDTHNKIQAVVDCTLQLPRIEACRATYPEYCLAPSPRSTKTQPLQCLCRRAPLPSRGVAQTLAEHAGPGARCCQLLKRLKRYASA